MLLASFTLTEIIQLSPQDIRKNLPILTLFVHYDTPSHHPYYQTFEKLAGADTQLNYGIFNCSDYKTYCTNLTIEQFPSIYMLTEKAVYRYNKQPNANQLLQWGNAMIQPTFYDFTTKFEAQQAFQQNDITEYFIVSGNEQQLEQVFGNFKGEIFAARILQNSQSEYPYVESFRQNVKQIWNPDPDSSEPIQYQLFKFIEHNRYPIFAHIIQANFQRLLVPQGVASVCFVSKVTNEDKQVLRKLRNAQMSTYQDHYDVIFSYMNSQQFEPIVKELAPQFSEQDENNYKNFVIFTKLTNKGLLFKSIEMKQNIENYEEYIDQLAKQALDNENWENMDEQINKQKQARQQQQGTSLGKRIQIITKYIKICITAILTMVFANKFKKFIQRKQKHTNYIEKSGNNEEKQEDEEKQNNIQQKEQQDQQQINEEKIEEQNEENKQNIEQENDQ